MSIASHLLLGSVKVFLCSLANLQNLQIKPIEMWLLDRTFVELLQVKVNGYMNRSHDCMLFSSIAEQRPHELHLRMNDTQESRFSDDVYQRIQNDVKGTMSFLEKFMTSPGVIMKTVRCISGKLLEKDIHGE